MFNLGEITEVKLSGQRVTHFTLSTEPEYQYTNVPYTQEQIDAYSKERSRNLLYDKTEDESVSNEDVLTFDNMPAKGDKTTKGRPVVNPIMSVLGEAISIPKVTAGEVVDGSEDNTTYSKKSGDTLVPDDTSDDYNS